MTTTTKVPTFTDASASWTVTAPDHVVVIPPIGPASATNPLKIVIDYQASDLFSATHGIVDIVFTEPTANTPSADDLRLPVEFDIKNDLGVRFDGFALFTANNTPPNPPDLTDAHPNNYAHFHGITPTTFGTGETLSLFTQDFVTPAGFGPAGVGLPAPAVIEAAGVTDSGTAVTGLIPTFHEVVRPGVDDGFHLDFFPILTSGQTIVSLDTTNVTQAEGGNGATTPFAFTVFRSGDANAINSVSTSVHFAVTGSGANPADASDFAGVAFPSGTVTFAAGETSKTIVIPVAGDADTEPTETFTLALSNASGGAAIANDSATGTILDTPPPAQPNQVHAHKHHDQRDHHEDQRDHHDQHDHHDHDAHHAHLDQGHSDHAFM